MKPGRIPCSVPFCGRTASREKFPDAEEIICGKHWRMASKKARAFKVKAFRACEVAAAKCDAIETEGSEYAKANDDVVPAHILRRFHQASRDRVKAWNRAARAWERCKKQAIEAAVGI